MVKALDKKSTSRFSRFMALSICGWVLIFATVACLYFKYKFGISFASELDAIKSYFILYQEKDNLLIGAGITIALLLLTVCIRISAFKTFKLIKFILLLAPLLFTASLLILIFYLHQIIVTLNIPPAKNIYALTIFIQSFSLEALYNAISDLPYQLNTIKYPLYGVIYGYLSMFGIIILFPLMLSRKTQTLWRKLNIIISLLFLGVFCTSVYYLTNNFILHDPFVELEQIVSIFSAL